MKEINMIAAIGVNRELGYQNNLIWRLKQDMQFFREMTIGHPIIMGRKTFESLPKLLPKREHLVLSQQDLQIPGIKTFSSKDQLDLYLENVEEVPFVIGGASLYKMYLLEAKKIYLTEIQAFSKADVYFPDFPLENYEKNTLLTAEEDNVKFFINEYSLKKHISKKTL